MTALSIADLRLELGPKARPVEILRGVDLELEAGMIQGLAGESGSGKSMTAFTVLGLQPSSARVTGSIRLGGEELVGRTERDYAKIRGRRIAMVFQDPSTSLHPQLTVGTQLTDHMRRHLGLDRGAASERARELLERVKVPGATAALKRYPHEFSGGQRQRIAIAVALACDPEVLLADEPTTALDVTVQAGILHLLRELAEQERLAVMLVTHDLGVMSAVADRVAVMRQGQILEEGDRERVFTRPEHDYTRTLLNALPQAPAHEAAGPTASIAVLQELDGELDHDEEDPR